MRHIILFFFLLSFVISIKEIKAEKINFYQYKRTGIPYHEIKELERFNVQKESSLRTNSGKVNKAYLYGEIQNYLKKLKSEKNINLPEVTSENFPLKSVSEDEVGISIRISQRYKRVTIIDSDAVLLFDKIGRLLGVNSSLSEKFDMDVTNKISEKDAERIAFDSFVNFLSVNKPTLITDPLWKIFYEDPLALSYLGTNPKLQNLVIEFIDGAPVLLWEIKFYITSDKTQIQDELNFVKFYIDAKSGALLKFLFEPYLALKLNIYDAQLTSNIIPIPTSLYKILKIMDENEWNFPYTIMDPPDYARRAEESIKKIYDFYKSRFGRDSYDNAGSSIDVVVNVAKYNFLNPMQSNAAWIPEKRMLLFGAGNDKIATFINALDIVGHEYTHAVISSTSNLNYSGQTGAVNESLADTFGIFIEDEDYLLGEDVILKPINGAQSIRDMKNPKNGITPQPENVNSEDFKKYGESCKPTVFNDSCGVHILSGIPNKAAYLIIEKLGRSKAAKIYYRAMTERLKSNSDFTDLKNQLYESCIDLTTIDNSFANSDCKYIKEAFSMVGIK